MIGNLCNNTNLSIQHKAERKNMNYLNMGN